MVPLSPEVEVLADLCHAGSQHLHPPSHRKGWPLEENVEGGVSEKAVPKQFQKKHKRRGSKFENGVGNGLRNEGAG